MRPQNRNTVTGPTSEDTTAVEMARQAGISPKAFRHALRKGNLPWHQHNARWTVRRGSDEHRAMEHVLDGLILDSRSRQ